MNFTQYAAHRGWSKAYIGQLILSRKITPDCLHYAEGNKRPLIDSLKADEKLAAVLNKRPGAGRPKKKKPEAPNVPPCDAETPVAIADFAAILDQCSTTF